MRFQKWPRWRAILELAIICIADCAISAATKARFDTYKELKTRFMMLSLPLMPVSATRIRQLIASGEGDTQAITNMVSEPVARYISLNQLYRPANLR
jgi:nicotinate-nucleotide adenylyltransferase